MTYTALLILSSPWWHTKGDVNVLMWYNGLAVLVGISSFYFGGLMPSLGLFRGVASTFFVIFLMQKWLEVAKGLMAVFLAGLFLIAACFFAKAHPQLFVFT